MEPLEIATRFGTALGLGLLLGLERERSAGREDERFAGVRTFALLALLGAVAVWFHLELGLTALAAIVFLAVGGLVVTSHVLTAQAGGIGITTEVTALFTLLLGGLCGAGQEGLAASLAVVVLLLLAVKQWSHRFATLLEPADVEATLKFAIVTVIVLPLLPDVAYGPGPLKVLNPYKIWLMVVLISGLNFASYVLVKVLGREHGIGLTGLLGGLVSSTAVTLGFSQRSRQEPGLAPSLAVGILLAWTLMYFRILVVVGVVNPALVRPLATAMGLLGVVSLAACFALWFRHRATEQGAVQAGANPFELGEAIKFGLLFGVVTFVAKAAEVYLGNAGLYLAGALAGLTDVDAISLSMASLSKSSPESTSVAAVTILVAVLANTVTKAGMAVFMGHRDLRRLMLPIGVLLLVAGAGATLLIR